MTEQNKLDVVTFGEPLVMFYANEIGELDQIYSFSKALAGAESNVAIGLSRLGHRTGLVAKLGNDSFASFIKATLQHEGVDISSITTSDERPTGMLIKSKVASGDPKVEYFRKFAAASTLSLSDFDHNYFESARHLHATSISAALSNECFEFATFAMEHMKRQGKTVSFDPNLRPVLWKDEKTMIEGVNKLAILSDWFLPGLGEGKRLTGYDTPEAIADFYLERGPSIVVIKLGPEGAYYKTKESKGIINGFKVEQVIDTVGAGDGFAVGVISGLLEGLELPEAVKRGNAIGALAVMSPGDMDGLPDRAKLEGFMKI
jgi:2-dehydro-3-deoxygluconokinase